MITFADPTDAWLEISPAQQETVWQHSQCHAPNRRWNAYLNRLCLDTVLPWIKAEHAPEATIWQSQENLSSIWDVVNGAAIVIGNQRLVLLPSEAIDNGELEVPQEWIDIPEWTADYYLALQIQLDEQENTHWVRIWGYTTHQDLKMHGYYDADDRTYRLEAQNLIRDIGALWVTLQFCPEAQTKAAALPLADLSNVQAENLIQRLSNAVIPRLVLPFAMWGALLSQDDWRQQMYRQQSSGLIISELTNLSRWFQRHVATGWQSLEALFNDDLQLAINLRSAPRDTTLTQGKQIILSTEPPQTVLLLLSLASEADERVAIMAQLHLDSSQVTPANLTLNLLADTGETLQSVQARPQDSYIQLRRFRCPVGTQFSLQIQFAEFSITEDFVV
ncbi:MAG: DUF1822 family protein [Drouetiella hepatica Uher 2000/2452]|jgi:hypothetical protein|uniref:DUF1822 family protein n=1 Tax=Drouetiella hepatica Uher 2000/2452 TaxID=904376 RepID=A0A951QFU2_9CYAN|nr:DUF1822 family protein [Drouetiella hepatica Uher 2000/2452]